MMNKFSVVYDNQGAGSEHATLLDALLSIEACINFEGNDPDMDRGWSIVDDELGLVLGGTAEIDDYCDSKTRYNLLITEIFPAGKPC